MEKSFWIQAVQANLNKQVELFEEYYHLGMSLYLFGSATKNDRPHDLDIVILYQDRDIIRVQEIRDITIQYLESVFNIPVDCVLLSIRENEQVRFTIKEKAELVFPLA